MENKRAAVEMIDAFRRLFRDRYVLSFTCASGNHCAFRLSPNEGTLEEFQDPMLDYYKNNRTYIETYDYDKIHTYIKFINGLTCLARETQVVVRNVATNEEFHLPPPYNAHSDRSDKHSVFFCYDPATDKYKVLITTSVVNYTKDDVNEETRLAICTLGVDKSWRYSHMTGLYWVRCNSKSESVCVNGVLYCTNFTPKSKRFEDGVIAAFDVGRECFDIVAYPDGLSMSRHYYCSLINVKGSLAVVDVQELDLEGWLIRMWIKGPESWLEHRIQLTSTLENIDIGSLVFSFITNRNGELVIGVARKSMPRCWVFVHNMETGQWRCIGPFFIEGRSIHSHFLIHEYVDSPLLLRDIVGS